MDPELLISTTAGLLSALGASVESITYSAGHRTVVAVGSPDDDLLVGPGGEHLQALNIILRRLVESKLGETAGSFLLDVNKYYENQMEHIRSAARLLAQRARLFKRDVALEPMTSYERLVVHELFAEDPDIETRSEGEGKTRHIVLKYKITG